MAAPVALGLGDKGVPDFQVRRAKVLCCREALLELLPSLTFLHVCWWRLKASWNFECYFDSLVIAMLCADDMG